MKIEGAAVIPLSKGLFAVVSSEDEAVIKERNWFAFIVKGRAYAMTVEPVTRRRVLMHRFITGCPDGKEVDHVNGYGLDNRRENLRICERHENARNIPKRKTFRGRKPTSAYKGVSATRNATWRAQICVMGKQKYLGAFDTQEEAARAYDTAAKQFFGPFALVNFPTENQITVPPESKFFQEGTTECGSITTAMGKSEAMSCTP